MNQRFRFVFTGILITGLLVMSSTVKADTLLGSTVTGSMTAPTSAISVTTQFTSPAVIGPGAEFTGAVRNSSFGFDFGVIADFTNSGLILSVTSPNPLANYSAPFTFLALTFSDPAFVTPFTLTSFTCAPGVNACSVFGAIGPINGLGSNTLVDSTLTLDLGRLHAGEIYTFSDVAPVPEPSSVTFLGTGLLGLLGAMRKTSSFIRKA